MIETVPFRDTVRTSVGRVSQLREDVGKGRAALLVQHMRPKDWKKNPKTGLLEPDYRWVETQVGPAVSLDSAELLHEEEAWNVITNVGRVFLHTQGYNTSIAANGLNYIALSNDALTETSTSTTLSTEIAANGLTRAIGTVTLPTGSGNVTTVAKTFTASGAQAAQKAALFTAASTGTMNHALAFTQRTLATGDTLATTFSITLG